MCEGGDEVLVTLIDCLLSKGQENSENECDSSWNFTEVNAGWSCTGNEMCCPHIIQKEQDLEHEVVCMFYQFPQGTRTASQGNCSHHAKLLSAPNIVDVSMEAQPNDLSRTSISVDIRDWNNNFMNATQVNSGDNIPRNKMESFFIKQRMYLPEPEVGDVSHEFPQESTRASQGTST